MSTHSVTNITSWASWVVTLKIAVTFLHCEQTAAYNKYKLFSLLCVLFRSYNAYTQHWKTLQDPTVQNGWLLNVQNGWLLTVQNGWLLTVQNGQLYWSNIFIIYTMGPLYRHLLRAFISGPLRLLWTVGQKTFRVDFFFPWTSWNLIQLNKSTIDTLNNGKWLHSYSLLIS